MYKITIKGPAGKTNASDLSILDGMDCQECFSDYLFDHREVEEGHKSLIRKGVKSGYMRFRYNREDKKLYVEVKYTSKEKLDDVELKSLIEYTQGQMSDGIGENFEQEPVGYEDDGQEIFLSPWFRGQKLEATQTEVK